MQVESIEIFKAEQKRSRVCETERESAATERFRSTGERSSTQKHTAALQQWVLVQFHLADSESTDPQDFAVQIFVSTGPIWATSAAHQISPIAAQQLVGSS